jgi:putative alpha-1,2-mannosidase
MTKFIFLLAVAGFMAMSCSQQKPLNDQVNKFIGTGGAGRISPVASSPFGMVQIGVDTQDGGSGYHYDDTHILGVSHLHKSGGGCGDFLDILFLPLQPGFTTSNIQQLYSKQYRAVFSHEDEHAEPGYYAVQLYDKALTVELTSSLRCGVQRYSFNAVPPVIIDLDYGSRGACTIVGEDNFDTVFYSSFKMIDRYSVEGCRLTHGWAPEQYVYFHTTFSMPIKECVLYLDNSKIEGAAAEGTNIKAIITFEENNGGCLEIKTGISSVDTEGARKNHHAEIGRASCRERVC